MYEINFGALVPYLDVLFGGALLTLAVSAATVAVSFPLGLGGALLRTSQSRVARRLMSAYVQVLRNVPMLLVLFLIYFSLPEYGLKLSAFAAGVLGLSLNSIAYVIEIFRGGLAGIPRGQYEAASCLGLRPRQVFLYVTFPQLLRISFPALGNQVVAITLASSVVFFIGVEELTSVSNQVGARTFRYLEVFVIAGIFYVGAAQLVNRVWVRVGRRWNANPARAGR